MLKYMVVLSRELCNFDPLLKSSLPCTTTLAIPPAPDEHEKLLQWLIGEVKSMKETVHLPGAQTYDAWTKTTGEYPLLTF
jgi:hypothetical protein